MTNIIINEDLWEEDANGAITAWLFESGDTVDKGDVVAEIMVEKSQFEVTAPCNGILTITISEDAEVTKGDIIGEIT